MATLAPMMASQKTKRKDSKMILKIEIDRKKYLYLTRFASKEATRPQLQGVHIAKNADAVATDGHRLGVFKNAYTITAGEIPEEGVTIQNEKNTISALKKDKSDFLKIEIDTETKKATISTDFLTMGGALCDGNFPQYEKIIPESNPTNKINAIAFNPLYLADFAGYEKDDKLKLEFVADEYSPFIVRNNKLPDFLGVLMPCRF